MSNESINVRFDFRWDTPPGKDPDSKSPTLRRYHEILWSKPLPNGKVFNLDGHSDKGYLYHNSELGEFVLTSDTVLPTYSKHKRYSHIINQIPQEQIEFFDTIIYTIGGMMIFPGKKVDGKMTINGARGYNPKILDRFDLTLECIRRYYLGEESPLYNDLARYHQFFSLFKNFKGYVDFFLLQDLVTDDYSEVQFFVPFDDFKGSPRPDRVEGYMTFKEKTIAFVNNRNTRIANLNP